jgi:hypothetical protein
MEGPIKWELEGIFGKEFVSADLIAGLVQVAKLGSYYRKKTRFKNWRREVPKPSRMTPTGNYIGLTSVFRQ